MVEFDFVSMTKNNQVPNLTLQKSQIQEQLQKPMEVGQTWMLVDAKWFKNFKLFVGLEESLERHSNPIYPGPIDNSLLLEVNSTADAEYAEIKKELVKNLDYVAIPASAWELLHSWYGLMEPQKPIQRKIIAHSPKFEPQLEVYLVTLNLYDNVEFKNPYTHSFSAVDEISKVEKVCKEAFNVTDDQQFLLKCFYGPTQSQFLNDKSSTIHDESLNENLKICMVFKDSTRRIKVNSELDHCSDFLHENQDPAGQCEETSFIKPTYYKYNTPRIYQAIAGSPSASGLMNGHSSAYSTMGTAEGRGAYCLPGLSGLLNLGNTCFLNSIVQCLSNCEPISKYFLDKNHVREINATNPLGKSGLIASSFAELISMMWSGMHTTTVPKRFKLQLTKFAPQFAGCQQHDAQELLTFLLDGLHEDLNRIKEKPYTQNEEEDQEDDTLARTSWENFLRRNDSIIIDHFHGMLKSRVMCPDCEKVSTKFDTFSTLSLPLPMRCDRTMKVRYVPYDQSLNVTDLLIVVPKKGTVEDMMLTLSIVTGVSKNHMIISQVYKCHFHKFFSQDDPLEGIDDRDKKIFMYDIPREMVDYDTSPQFTILPVVLWEIQDSISNSPFMSSLFGTPFLLYLPPGPMPFTTFYNKICNRMTRCCDGLYYPMQSDSDSADGENEKPTTSTSQYLFTPVLVNTYSFEGINKIDTSTDAVFQVLGNYKHEVLALQMEKSIHKRYYNEETPTYLDLSFSVKYISKLTLGDCLHLFTTTEKLRENNAWHCPNCNEMKRATKKLDLWKLPNILIFHLKRFAFNETKKEKLDTRVEFPLTDLNLDNYVVNKHKENLVYDLIGVCNHYGGLMGGHYTANCKHYKDGNWYCFDDDTVSLIPPESVQTENAYLLFYARRPFQKSDPNEEKVDF